LGRLEFTGPIPAGIALKASARAAEHPPRAPLLAIRKAVDRVQSGMSAPLLVGIAGGTGSGKTTLARTLAFELGKNVSLLEHDWYYRDRSGLSREERAAINYDEPGALDNDLLREHLLALRSGKSVFAPVYDFASHTRTLAHREVPSASVIAVEGMLLFAVPELCELFELRIFVDTDDDLRLLRRIRRDLNERGRDIESIAQQYEATVRPMHLRYVAPSRHRAHLIVPEGGENREAIDVIAARLKHLAVP
jgi:uridine kinase